MSDPLLRFHCEEHGWFVHQSLNQVFFFVQVYVMRVPHLGSWPYEIWPI